MPIGYSGAPRVTPNNMDSRLRRLSRSLKTGNSGTPLRTELYDSERFHFEAAPNSANTNSRRDVMNIFSTEFKNADGFVVNAVASMGYWNDCGFIELRCAADNTLVWGINNTFGGGPGAVVYMGSTGFMQADNTAFFYDETNDELNLYTNSTQTTPMLKLEQDGTGDAVLNFLLTGTAGFVIGVDNSDSDRLKIMAGNTFPGNPAGITVNTNGFVGFNEDNPQAEVHVANNGTGTMGIYLEQQGSGDPQIRMSVTGGGGTDYTFGIDNSQSDRFMISVGSTLSGNTFVLDADEHFGIRTQPNPAYTLDVGAELNTDQISYATIHTEMPGKVIAAGPVSNILIGCQIGTSDNAYNIATGVSDTGSREAFRIENFSSLAGFAGTLTRQLGGYFRVGHTAGTGTITNSVGVLIETLSSGSVTMTNQYGVFQKTQAAQNVFYGDTAFGVKADPDAKVHTYRNDSATTPSIIVEQDSTGDAAINFLLTSTVGWSIGLDNSDNDTFKISAGNTVDASTVWWILGGGDSGIGISPTVRFHAADGELTKSWSPLQGTIAIFEGTDGNRGFVTIAGLNQSEILFADSDSQFIGRLRYDHTSDQMQLYAGGAQKCFVNTTGFGVGKAPDTDFHVYANDASTAAIARIEQDSTGDATQNFLLTAGQGYAIGIDNSDSDQFKIQPGNTVASGVYGFWMRADGRIGLGPQSAGNSWVYVQPDYETSTGTRRSLFAQLPRKDVNANESNFLIGFNVQWQPGTFDIASGVTDSGSREAFRAEAFVNDSSFIGTLNKQIGFYVRTGHASGANNANAVITNSIGLDIENLSSGSVTVTNSYGVYQRSSGSDNYFAGNTGFGTNSPTSNVDINDDVIRVRTSKTPASASAAGNQGDIAWDSNYFYICVSTNTWQRVAHATW